MRVRENRLRKRCPVWAWAGSTTAGVSGVRNWAEGGSNRVALHIAGGALIGGLGGGGIGSAAAGAAGAGLSAALAPQLNSLSKGIAESTGSTLLGNLASNVLASAGGALVGGSAGAATAANADLFNRQLHPEEKTLAKQLADKSGGQYTQAQIEDQMRIMGVSANGTNESGAPSTLIGQMPTDSGAQWMSGGTTDGGKPILTQITAQANPELQSYILANYNGASTGGVPSQFTYALTGNTGSTNITGPFTKFDKSDADFMRNTTADTASMISTNAGRFSAAAAAAATIPSPYSGGLSAAAYTATVAGFAADALAQLVKPDVGQYAVSGATGLIAGNLSDRVPAFGPAINETANTFNNSSAGQQVQNSLNKYWSDFVNYWSSKR